MEKIQTHKYCQRNEEGVRIKEWNEAGGPGQCCAFPILGAGEQVRTGRPREERGKGHSVQKVCGKKYQVIHSSWAAGGRAGHRGRLDLRSHAASASHLSYIAFQIEY